MALKKEVEGHMADAGRSASRAETVVGNWKTDVT